MARARRPFPKPPKAKKPSVVLRRFGPTGKPVTIDRAKALTARREGLRVYEDNSIGTERPQPSRARPPLPGDRREGMPSPSSRPSSGKSLRTRAGYGGFKPNAKLDPSQVRDLRFDTHSERMGMKASQPPKRPTRRANPPLPRPASRRRPE